jgi:hypothetical protein
MAGLTSKTIASSYDQLIISNNASGGDTSTPVTLQDGDGVTTYCVSMSDASTGKAVLAVDGSHASGTEVQIDNSATDGDSFLSYQLSGTSVFTMGIDDGDSDKFKIGTTAIGTNTRLSIDSSGHVAIANNLDVDGTTNLDAVDIDGAVQLDGTFSVGVDNTGYDVKLFGATAGKYLLWDETNDKLVLEGLSSGGNILQVQDGTSTLFEVQTNEIIFNESGRDTDVRFESDGNTHMLFVDGGANEVGIGATPTEVLSVISAAGATRGVLEVKNTSDNHAFIVCDSAVTGAGSGFGGLRGYWNGTEVTRIGFESGTDTTNKDDGKMTLYTRLSGSGIAAAMTLSDSGNVGIGDTDPSEAKLSIDSVASGDHGIKVVQAQNTSAVMIDNNGTQSALYIENTGSTGTGLEVYSNIGATVANPLVSVHVDDPAYDQPVVKLHSDSLTSSILYFESGATSGNTIYVDTPVATTGNIINIHQADSLTTGNAIRINCGSAGLSTGDDDGLVLIEFDAATSSSSTTNNLLYIVNENAGSDGTVPLKIKQDGADAHIEFTGAGGGGIKFNASAMSSSDVNTLDDYEEGTWTPVLKDSNDDVVVFSTEVGTYTKIGKVVHVQFYITTSSLGDAASGGALRLFGLPFSTSATANSYATLRAGYGTGLAIDAGDFISCYINTNAVFGHMQLWTDAGGSIGFTDAHLSADGGLMMQGSYIASV